MAKKTLKLEVVGLLTDCQGQPLEESGTYDLALNLSGLDHASVTVLAPIVSRTKANQNPVYANGVAKDGLEYQLEYEADDLPSPFTSIDICDVDPDEPIWCDVTEECGCVADGETILGAGTQADPFRVDLGAIETEKICSSLAKYTYALNTDPCGQLVEGPGVDVKVCEIYASAYGATVNKIWDKTVHNNGEGLSWTDDATLQAELNDIDPDTGNNVPDAGNWTVVDGKMRVVSTTYEYTYVVLCDEVTGHSSRYEFDSVVPATADLDLRECLNDWWDARVAGWWLEHKPAEVSTTTPTTNSGIATVQSFTFTTPGSTTLTVPPGTGQIILGGIGPASAKAFQGKGAVGGYGEITFDITNGPLVAGDSIIVYVGNGSLDPLIPTEYTGFFKTSVSVANALMIAPGGGAGGNLFDGSTSNTSNNGKVGGKPGFEGGYNSLEGEAGHSVSGNAHGYTIVGAGGGGYVGGSKSQFGGRGGTFFHHSQGQNILKNVGSNGAVAPPGTSHPLYPGAIAQAPGGDGFAYVQFIPS